MGAFFLRYEAIYVALIFNGCGGQIRTADNGFKTRCLTAWLLRNINPQVLPLNDAGAHFCVGPRRDSNHHLQIYRILRLRRDVLPYPWLPLLPFAELNRCIDHGESMLSLTLACCRSFPAAKHIVNEIACRIRAPAAPHQHICPSFRAAVRFQRAANWCQRPALDGKAPDTSVLAGMYAPDFSGALLTPPSQGKAVNYYGANGFHLCMCSF